MSFSVESIRKEFPILERKIHGRDLVYFDNAATTLKPKRVVDRIARHYLYETSNVHRGIHTLSSEATTEFERAREVIRKFINARETDEIVFTSGTTGGINIVSQCFTRAFMKPGDEIIVTELEHHSDIVPWQLAAEAQGLKLKVARIEESGQLTLDSIRGQMTEKTRLIAVAAVSNTLGTTAPVEDIIKLAHASGARVLVDAAQAVAHNVVDVQVWDCDFLVFSAHKLFGPTGFGVLYGRGALLKEMPPLFGGGAMIRKVLFEGTTYEDAPQRFEAGTPHIAGAIGTAAAIEFISSIGLQNIREYEHILLNYATERLQTIPGLRIFGTSRDKGPIISFLLGATHPHDVGTLLDEEGIAVRTGHHCTQPLMAKWQIPGTVRASFAMYNTKAEIDRMIETLIKIRGLLE